MADRYPLVYNPSAGQIQELAAGDNITIDSSTLKNVTISGITTFTGGDINIDSGGVYYDSANKRLAVGTTSPGGKLVVSDGSTTFQFDPVGGTGNILRSLTTGGSRDALLFDASQYVYSNGATEYARIDSSGRLLVGTSSDVSNGLSYTTTQIINSAWGTLSLGTSATGIANDTNIGEIRFYGNSGNTAAYGQFAKIACVADGTASSNADNPGRLVFSTTADGASSPTERMRIDSNGNLLVGTTAALHSQFLKNSSGGIALQVSNTSTTTSSSVMELNVNYTGGTSGWFVRGGDNASYHFYVYSNGNVANSNNSYGAVSDIKLKENIVDAGSQWGDLKSLQVRKYNFKEGLTHTQIGLIAQEVEVVSPGLVFETPDRDEDGNDLGTVTKSVNYSVLYMKAVKALQEAMERIETLEARLTAAGI
jgi:hypothetical protein